MAAITKESVLEQLRTVHDPELHKDIVSLNMVKDIAVHGSRVRVHVEDGRFFLQASRERYDLITSEPPPPRAARVTAQRTTSRR